MQMAGETLDIQRPPTRDELDRLEPHGVQVRKYQSIEPQRSTMDEKLHPFTK